MYDELIKSLRVCASSGLPDSCLKCPRFENGCDTLREDAADAIEELQKAVYFHKYNSEFWEDKYNSLVDEKWIPVTEQLPETPGEYMVAYHPCYWDRVHDEIKVGLDSFRGKTSWAKKKYQRVTHWMPLPEPPKEG